MLEGIQKRVETVEALETEVSPVIGTHAGPGTVGICFQAGI
jgi:fatty acid-binding protein DegV